MMSLLVNVSGIVLMGLIGWWFILKKTKTQTIERNQITIIVDEGVYTPAVIEAQAGQDISLHFKRLDPSPCAEVVVFSNLDKTLHLRLNETEFLRLRGLSQGEYPFTCQMGMYQGVLIIN